MNNEKEKIILSTSESIIKGIKIFTDKDELKSYIALNLHTVYTVGETNGLSQFLGKMP